METVMPAIPVNASTPWADARDTDPGDRVEANARGYGWLFRSTGHRPLSLEMDRKRWVKQ
jgi:hypothetical protein